MRLGPDGKPIFVNTLTQTRYFEMVDALQLIKPTWAKVGIDLQINNIDLDLFYVRLDANEYDCAVDIGELGYIDMINDPRWLFATGGEPYAPFWGRWYNGETPNEEPPESMKRQMKIYLEKVRPATDSKTQYEGMRTITEIARDEFWCMGISLPAKPYAVVTDRFHNVPNNMWLAFKYPTPGPTNICQYFISEDS